MKQQQKQSKHYLQNIKIDKTQLQQLQSNLIQSHACGMGEEVPLDIVKLMVMLKIKNGSAHVRNARSRPCSGH